MSNLPEFVADHLLIGVERQAHLRSLVGPSSGFFDRTTSSLVFDGRPKVRVDVIGSAEPEPGLGSWTWAWASAAPPASAGALALRSYGEMHGLSELVAPSLRLGEPPGGVDEDLMGMVATAALGGQAYQVISAGHRLTVLVLYEPALELPVFTLASLRATLATGIGLYGVELRRALRPYLQQRSATVAEDGGRWLVTTPGGEAVTLGFDSAGMICAFEVAGAQNQAQRPGKRRDRRG